MDEIEAKAKELLRAKEREKKRIYRQSLKEKNKVATPIIDEKKESSQPQKKTDFPVEAISIMKEQTGKMMKDPVTGEEDPVLKTIDRIAHYVEKYSPLIMSFMQGIKARNDEMQAQRAQVQQQMTFQPQGVQAPPGWEGMSPIDKMKRKYDGEGNLSAWYQAGLQYDQYMATGQVVQIQQPQYHRPQSRQEQPQRREMTHEPQNLKDLSNKYPEPPLENETPSQPVQAQNPHHDMEPMRQDGSVDQIPPEQKLKFEENMKYLAIAINYLNNMSETEFRALLNDLDGSFKKISSPFVKMMIPNDVKVMIKQIDANQLTSLLQESCPEKYKIIEETKSMSPLSTRFIAWRDAL